MLFEGEPQDGGDGDEAHEGEADFPEDLNAALGKLGLVDRGPLGAADAVLADASGTPVARIYDLRFTQSAAAYHLFAPNRFARTDLSNSFSRWLAQGGLPNADVPNQIAPAVQQGFSYSTIQQVTRNTAPAIQRRG